MQKHFRKPGERFGKLVLVRTVSVTRSDGNKRTSWECRCDCGNTTIVRNGRVHEAESCGCLRFEPKYDLTKRKCGRLQPIEHLGTEWRCRCDCGNEVIIGTNRLVTGETRSCGCLRREVSRAKCTTHGLAHLPEYFIWIGLKQRCFNKAFKQWDDYGGRGIKVSPEWTNDFAAFYRHIGPRPTPLHTIERIDNDGNYEPGNVRWATRQEQNVNKRDTRRITALGRTQSITVWAREIGISVHSLTDRIDKYGWPPEVAVTTPRMKHRHDQRSPIHQQPAS